MSALRGDFAQLRLLTQGIEKLERRAFLRDVVRGMGAQALGLTLEGFERSRDPYGQRWRRLESRKGKPLLDTGRLRNSIAYRASGVSFALIASARYASVHQGGALVRHGKRMMAYSADTGRFVKRSLKATEGFSRVSLSYRKASQSLIPARPFFPVGALPAAWEKELRAIAEKALLMA